MALYAALVYMPTEQYWTSDMPQPDARHTPSPDYAGFAAEAAAAGACKGGEALYPPQTATTITVAGGKGGDVVITDGPYAEAKEVLGGYFLIEAADLDEATAWAAKIPGAWNGGKVELRPVARMDH